MQKKWSIGIIVGVVLLAGVGGAGIYAARNYCQKVGLSRTARLQADSPVYMDLLYLNTINGLKLTPTQAQAILPLVEKLKDADSSSTAELSKEIYAQLNAQQYLVLESGNGPRRVMGIREMPMMEGRLHTNGDNHGQSVRQAALPDVVIKQLKDLAAQAQ